MIILCNMEVNTKWTFGNVFEIHIKNVGSRYGVTLREIISSTFCISCDTELVLSQTSQHQLFVIGPVADNRKY